MHLKWLVVIIALGFAHSQTNSKEPTLTWDTNSPLTWHDFKGRPNSNSQSVALTASGISFGYSLKTMDGRIIDFTAEVEANFYPEKSWYLKDRADAYTLKHEQLHFDITELYARKFRQGIAQLKVNANIKHQLEQLNRSINRGVNTMQKRYDLETNHSINTEAQELWNRFIADELAKLKRFSSK